MIVEARDAVAVVGSAKNQIRIEIPHDAEDRFTPGVSILQVKVHGVLGPENEARVRQRDLLGKRKVAAQVGCAVLQTPTELSFNCRLHNCNLHRLSSRECLRKPPLTVDQRPNHHDADQYA